MGSAFCPISAQNRCFCALFTVHKAIINGEDFDIFNAKARELKSTYKELEQLLKVCNHGVTVVEL